jgi:hypothetical protein
MFDHDPRWGSDPRERDDDARDRDSVDARDACIDKLDLPRGLERELVRDRRPRRVSKPVGLLDISRGERANGRLALRSGLRGGPVPMTAEDRVKAVAKFGFTERQAQFLVTVMLHSGVCLLRQYTAFAGIVHGQKTRTFFAKIVRRGQAMDYPCRHNHGRVYHLHQKPLYRAIGQTDSRHRRPMFEDFHCTVLKTSASHPTAPGTAAMPTGPDGKWRLAHSRCSR